MAGYVKVWTDIENDADFLRLKLNERGLFLQMLVSAKKDGDTGYIRAQNWSFFASRWACDQRTCRKIAALLSSVDMIEIREEENLIELFIPKYHKWQGLSVSDHYKNVTKLQQNYSLPDQTRPEHTNKELPASPPVKHTKADVDKGEFDKLGLVAVKLGFGDNGPKCVNAMFKKWPSLRSEPQRLAWYLSRVSHRRYVELEPIAEPWAYLTEIITKYYAVPAVCQGGDDNCYKEHLTVSEYCDPILGIPKQPDPLRGGGFERITGGDAKGE